MTRRVLTVAPHPCIIRHSPYALNAESHGAPHGPSPQGQLRAGFAMSTRRLELSFEQLKTKTTSQLAEPRPSRPPIQQPKDGIRRCRYSCRSKEMNDGEQSLRRRSWCCASRSMSCGGPPKRLLLSSIDRLIFVGLYRLVPDVRGALAIVKPDTVI